MIERALIVLILFAAIGSGVVAGIFFAFSSFVMPALARVDPRSGIEVMNAINVTVYNRGFMFVFMGTAAACLLLAPASYLWWDRLDGKLLLFAALTFLTLSVFVTLAFNVPLNDALSVTDDGSHQQAELWGRVLDEWPFWNHARTLASMLSAITLTIVLLRHNGF